LNFRATIQIFAGDVRSPAGDLNFPRTPQIFSARVDFLRSFSIVLVTVLNFRRNTQRSADDLSFRPQFSIFAGCFECSAELLKLRRHFRFSPRFDFSPPGETGKPRKKRNPARVLNGSRIGRTPV